MHIIYFITKLELGGAQKVCLALHKELKTKDAVSTTLISGNQGVLVAATHNNPSVILLPTLTRELSITGIWNEIKTFFYLIKVLRDLRKNNPDQTIIHTHSTKAGIMGRWAAFFAGISIRVHTVHGFAFHEHQSRLKWLIIFMCEWITSLITTHFVMVSSYDQKIGLKYFPFFNSKNSIIRAPAFISPPQKIDRHQPPFSTENPMVIGSVSCFKPQKNLDDLLTIFSNFVQTPNVYAKLEIIGDGELRTHLENLTKKLSISHLVSFVGWQKNISPFLSRWHLFALTSLWEGLPCAIIEARMFQIPVASYNTGGIKDVVFSEKNGALFNQFDTKSFQSFLEQCYSQPEFYQKLATHPDDLSDFTVETMANQHLKLYEKLII